MLRSFLGVWASIDVYDCTRWSWWQFFIEQKEIVLIYFSLVWDYTRGWIRWTNLLAANTFGCGLGLPAATERLGVQRGLDLRLRVCEVLGPGRPWDRWWWLTRDRGPVFRRKSADCMRPKIISRTFNLGLGSSAETWAPKWLTNR